MPSKICVNCCRELTYVAQLLFKWRKSIILTLDQAEDQMFISEEEEERKYECGEDSKQKYRVNGIMDHDIDFKEAIGDDQNDTRQLNWNSAIIRIFT